MLFNGYYLEENKTYIPNKAGVYCVYSCIYSATNDTVSLKKLLYIGESNNVGERITNHDRCDDWKRGLLKGETICYSFAPVNERDRERAEAALIFELQPPYNTEHKGAFIYEDTEIKASGKNMFLPEEFVVEKGESH